jgi:hypothetical protein
MFTVVFALGLAGVLSLALAVSGADNIVSPLELPNPSSPLTNEPLEFVMV